MVREALRHFGQFLVSLTDADSSERRITDKTGRHSARDFQRNAARLAQSREPRNILIAGGIELLGLRDILRDMGSQTGLNTDLLSLLAERAIRHHLDPDDTFMKRDDDNYLLCFASPDISSARRKLEKITSEIRHALQTGSSDSGLDVTHEIVEVDVEEIDDLSIIDTISESLKRVKQEAENSTRLWRQHLVSNASVSYRPVWQTQKQVVAIHRAVLDDDTGRFALKRLTSLSSAEDMRTTLFEIDSLILGRSTAALHNLVAEGRCTQLIVPLYYGSLESRARRARYQQLCENIPAGYRRYMLFELHDIPAGTPKSRISEIAATLSAYGHGVLLEVGLDVAKMPSAIGIAGVVTHSPEHMAVSDFAHQASRFAIAAKAARLRSFMYDLQNASLTRVAAAAGIDYLQGAAIAKSTRELKPHYRWELRIASRWTCKSDQMPTAHPVPTIMAAKRPS